MNKLNMNRKLKRTLPFLWVLRQAPDSKKQVMLRSFPSYVVDDMVEILYNILHENVPIRNPGHKNVLLKKKLILSNIARSVNNKKLRKQLIYNQKGGFLGAVIPILSTVLGGLLGSL